MKQTSVVLAREKVDLTSNLKDQYFKYKCKHGITYNYAMPWRICNTYGKKGNLAKYCRCQNVKKAK